MTARAPASTALEMASVIPRSLKDPVGLAPSNFRYRSMSGAIFLASLEARMSGVLPSPSDTTGVRSVTGRNFRYSSISPRQRFIVSLVLTFNANQCSRFRHEGHVIDFLKCLLNIPFLRHMCLDDNRHGLARAPTLLQHGRNANSAMAQLSRNLCQHSRPVEDHEAQVVERVNFLHRTH